MPPRKRPASQKWRAGLFFLLPLLLPSLSLRSPTKLPSNLLQTNNKRRFDSQISHIPRSRTFLQDKSDNINPLDFSIITKDSPQSDSSTSDLNFQHHAVFNVNQGHKDLLGTSLKSKQIDNPGDISDREDFVTNLSSHKARLSRSISLEEMNPGSVSLIGGGRWTIDRLFANIDLCILTLAGLVTCFLGGVLPKTSLHLLTFAAAYYSIFLGLFFARSFDVDSVHQQMGLFFGSLLLAFCISVCAFFFESMAHLVFLLAFALSGTLFTLQFILPSNMVFSMYALVSFAGPFLLGYFLLYFHEAFTKFLISLFTGTLLFTMNLSFLLELGMPFNERIVKNMPYAPFKYNILSAFGLVLISSFFFQICFLKRTSCWVGLGKGRKGSRRRGSSLKEPDGLELVAADSIR